MAVLMPPAPKFTVRRRPAVLVVPALSTPRELKQLSDIDDQMGLRFYAPAVFFYRRDASMDGRDPAAVILDAVAKALVYYYPLAGRLRELDGSKLAVDCIGEGALFVDADADVRIEHFGDAVHPPFPYLEELLFEDEPAGPFAVVNYPLVHIQVTRLACGGFVLATRICHSVADATGMVQFLQAVAELARGAAAPTVHPVWARDLLTARDPPRPSFVHREFDGDDDVDALPPPLDQMVQRSVFFAPQDVSRIKAQLPAQLRKQSTTFDVVTGFLWKCRTMALVPDADEEMRLGSPVSAYHGNRGGLRLPRGYYGNTIVLPVAISTAGKLCANPVGYAVELVRKAKAEVDAEYIQSVADLMVMRERKQYATSHLYVVSDVTKIDSGSLDCGWGKPVYGGVAAMGPSPVPGMSSFLISSKNAKGENGFVVPMCLPGHAMDRFIEAMGKLMRAPATMSSAL